MQSYNNLTYDEKLALLDSLMRRTDAGVDLDTTEIKDISLDNSPEVRRLLMTVIGYARDERLIPILISAADNDIDEEVRTYALLNMDEYNSQAIFECLIREVGRPSVSRRPRQIVAEQLRHYDNSLSVDALITLFDDADYIVSDNAIDSLFLLNREELKRFWVRVLHGNDGRHQLIAERALHNIGHSIPG